MRRPPDKRTAPEASRGGDGSGSAELKSRQQSDSERSHAAQAIRDATGRAEDLLALWREQRRLSHRVRLARLKFELIGLDPEIEAEVIAWKRLIEAFAHAERSVEMAERRGA